MIAAIKRRKSQIEAPTRHDLIYKGLPRSPLRPPLVQTDVPQHGHGFRRRRLDLEQSQRERLSDLFDAA
jgi:hypothetical protein